MKRLVIFTFILCSLSCRKDKNCDGDPIPYSNAVSKNIYFNADTIIAIRNKKDTLFFIQTNTAAQTNTLIVCDNNCVMSGSCGSKYELTSFPIRYLSIDKSQSFTVTRTYYKSNDDFESYFDDQYDYSFGSLKYSLPGTMDKDPYDNRNRYADTSNNQNLYVLLNGIYDSVRYHYYGYLYLDGEKIKRHIDTRNNDTLDFIN